MNYIPDFESHDDDWEPPKQFEEIEFPNEGEIKPYYPPLVDHRSAYQIGLLDAVTGRWPLNWVLIAAEERVLNDRYSEGYAMGCNLADKGII